MSAKNVVVIGLLAFVAVSLGFMMFRDAGAPAQANPVPDAAVAEVPAQANPVPPAATDTAVPAPEAAVAEAPAHQVIVYYFHATQRCRTCIAIQKQAEAAVHEEFAPELADGLVVWREVNYDEPANRAFVQQYELVTSSLVLVDQQDGATTEWRNLDDVWKHVNNEGAFREYVTGAVRAYLES